ncbi:MAG: hypothetical protein JO356_17435 [Acidobacteria bacterium]|nr:hypothetical protein [Acidobacteriota bacterium]
MKNSWSRKAIVVLALTTVGIAAGCFDADVDGKYREAEGAVKLELKEGKATLDVGQVRIDGKYTVDGDKVTIRPVDGPNPDTLVLTVGKDGSLSAPPNGLFTKLVKTK